ncbi:hypothetical protein ACSBR2_000222 [Camellia fascicularis]
MVENYRIVWLAVPCVENSDRDLQEVGKEHGRKAWKSSYWTMCTICLAEYHKEDILRILLFCRHSFHAACIDKWLQQHSTCPVCRISLLEFLEKKLDMHSFGWFAKTLCLVAEKWVR